MTPDAKTPTSYSGRRFSFAAEFYAVFRRAQSFVLRTYEKVFPNPLAVPAKALARAGLRGDGKRGGSVIGESGEGRIVGRHPSTGVPVVAWTVAAYESMCDAFDSEHAARIVAWREGVEPLMLSTEACTRWGLRADKALRLSVVVQVVGFGCLGMAMGISANAGTVSGLMMALGFAVSSAMFGVAIGLSMLLIGAIASMLGITGLAGLKAAVVGVRASRRARHATATDEAGRTSAAQIVASMQEKPTAAQQEAASRSIEQG